MLKVLVVDDEVKIREVVREYANASGFECDEAEDGYQAVIKTSAKKYDCIVLDIMMPGLDGFSALKEIRKKSDVSVIMLSARQEEEDKLASFEIGVDDYVTKPFSPKELMARIKAVCDRRKKTQGQKFIYETLELDIDGRVLTIDGEKIMVTPKELDLLILFVKNSNIALDREKILENVWGYDYDGDDRTVDTHVKMLRKSLGKYKDCISTVRSVGYKFEI